VESGLGTKPYGAGSVSGLGHFQKGTWDDMVKNHGVNSRDNFGMTKDGKLDAFQGAVAVVLYAKINADKMMQNDELRAIVSKRSDKSFTEYELNMAHFLGGSGAARFLTGLAKDPNAPATSYARAGAVNANQTIFYYTDARGNPMLDKPRTAQEVFKLKSNDFDAKVRQFQARLNAQNPQQ
jgi:hypothetical protein